MTPSDVKIVADNINDFIEVPDGITRLRKAVLTLAMSGQLVEQDEKEGTAEDFYLKIQNDRKKEDAGATGRKRKVHDFAPLTSEEIPFELPTSWKWVRLGEIVEFRVGKTPPRKEPQYWSNAEVPWVSIADLNAGGVVSSTKEKINSLALDKVFGGYIAPKGTLLFSFKLTIGKMSLLEVDACHNEAIAAFFPINDILRDYLFNILSAVNTTGRTSNAIKGKTLNSETLALIEVPLPPLAEQKRIVEKVQSVMKQLDELESRKNERDIVRSRLTRSAMQALGSADSKIAFDQLTELIKTSEDLKELENSILNLAISGRLIRPCLGTVDDLYQDIKLAREKAGNDTVARKKKESEFAPIDADETPFEIPKTWKWVRLGEIFLIERGGSPRPIESFLTDDPKGLNWIKIGDTEKGGKYISSTKERIIKEGLKKTRQVHSGDLLLTNSMSFGRPYILKIDGCIHDGWLALRPYHDDLVRDFYYYALSSPVFFQQFLNLVSGAVVKNLNAEKVRSVLIPLPPITEQKQIVEKIEELMKMVNELKTIISN